MAKVSLRIYNREIEGLIDQGRIDEAIAHCQHILKTFSKHLETYRLLGKAFLESKRYNEAVDIFSRVLMSVPDDFVSHVGMSIIRDEENKMDDAIWHMERAFEAQPSNAAIQGELQRLYGRRDGMEPPKIRMTRGALAHMYVQGELYPQAIAEIRAVLAQDPQRTDMQVLLARALFRGGQKADASDMCVQLLKQYTYNFDANRVMVELIPSTAGAAESTQVYRMRVSELDPYTTFAKGSVFQSAEVADAAINLERLEYTGQEVPMGKEWGASLGLGAAASAPSLSATSSSDQPDWLKSAGLSDSQPASASSAPANDNLPDFMRAAGWGASTTPEQPTSFFDDEPAANDLTPADMPDWLKEQVPANIAPPANPQPAPEQSLETPDGLTGLGDADSAASATAQPGNVPDWLSGLGNDDPEPSKVEPAQPANIPDWLSGLDNDDSQPSSNMEPAQPGNVPDWLSGLGDPQSSEAEPIQAGNLPDWLNPPVEAQSSESAQTDDAPDWLNSLGNPQSPVTDSASQADNAPDWLNNFGDSQPAATEPAAQAADIPDWLSGLDNENEQTLEPVAQSSDIPDWLSDMDKKDQPASSENLGASAQEQDDAVAWLESLAAKHGAKPEELVTDPNKRSETPPEWVTQAQNLNQQTPAPTVESLGSSAQEQDDAVAWLESLAAKHGAKPEELVTDPNKRNETPPEWVSQAQNLNQQTPAPTVESLGSSAQEQDDAVAWLESLAAKHGAKPEELVTDPNKRNETPPEWVSQAQNLNQQTPAPTVESLGSSAQEQDDAVAWLESLAAKHGAKPEELVTDPNKRSETPPEWVSQAQNLNQQEPAPQADRSEWVENAQNIGEQFFAEFENPVESKPEQPAIDETGMWLRSLDAPEESQPEQNLQRGDIPDWLNDTTAPKNDDGKFEFIQETTAQKSDLPNWLDEKEDVAEQSSFTDKDMPQDDLSNWLSGLDDEPGLPFETMPTPDSILTAPKSEPPVVQKSDLPDWLDGVDNTQDHDFEDEWKKTVEEAEAHALASSLTEATAPVNLSADLPDWLQGVDDEAPPSTEDDTPPWLHREAYEAGQVQQQPMPTSPSDWRPLEESQPEPASIAPVGEPQPVAKQPSQPAPEPVKKRDEAFIPPPPEPVSAQPAAPAAPRPEAPAKKKSGLPARQRQPEAQNPTIALSQAKGELDRGDIPTALDHYRKLIKKGKHLEETIRDLTESIYRYPVEVGIWQTLGDAYMRANRLKEALEAYNKAEELIR